MSALRWKIAGGACSCPLTNRLRNTHSRGGQAQSASRCVWHGERRLCVQVTHDVGGSPDEAAERVRDVDRLRKDYQAIRSALVSLRRSLAQASRLVEALSAAETAANEEVQQGWNFQCALGWALSLSDAPVTLWRLQTLQLVREKLQTVVIADERAADIQKLRAKRRYVLEYSSQVKREVEEVHQRRTEIDSELETHKSEAETIRQFLQHEELKVESVQARIREETAQVILETSEWRTNRWLVSVCDDLS